MSRASYVAVHDNGNPGCVTARLVYADGTTSDWVPVRGAEGLANSEPEGLAACRSHLAGHCHDSVTCPICRSFEDGRWVGRQVPATTHRRPVRSGVLDAS